MKVVGYRGMNEESRWNVNSWNALRGFPWDAIERGADAAEAIQAPRLEIIHLPLAPPRRIVTRADSRKYFVTIGCAACSDLSVHGKTTKLHTE